MTVLLANEPPVGLSLVRLRPSPWTDGKRPTRGEGGPADPRMLFYERDI